MANESGVADHQRTTLRRTRARVFLLNELETRGRRSFPGKYTLSLRIMEERGYVRRSMNGNWSTTRLGQEALLGWLA